MNRTWEKPFRREATAGDRKRRKLSPAHIEVRCTLSGRVSGEEPHGDSGSRLIITSVVVLFKLLFVVVVVVVWLIGPFQNCR